MKYLNIAVFGFLFFAVDTSSLAAQGACPGPNCRSASSAAAVQAATKAADDKKKAQHDAVKAAKIKENRASSAADNSSGAQNKKQPIIRPPCDPMSGSCRQRGSMGIRG